MRTRDEIGDLTAAFNEMSRNLAIKEELLNEQRRENDRLMLALMPESVLQRYREGEETIAQKHQDVAIIYADIVGLDEMFTEMPEDELVGTVDELFRQFDSAAESLVSNGSARSTTVISPAVGSSPRDWTASTVPWTSPSKSAASSIGSTAKAAISWAFASASTPATWSADW